MPMILKFPRRFPCRHDLFDQLQQPLASDDFSATNVGMDLILKAWQVFLGANYSC